MTYSTIFMHVLLSYLNLMINQYTIGTEFAKYENAGLIEVSDLEAVKNGFAANHNYISQTQKPTGLSFQGYDISKCGFQVENDTIKGVLIYLEINDPDIFYKKLVDTFGKPELTRISSVYLKKHGLNPPNGEDSQKYEELKTLPEPQLEDYKYLNNVSWYEIETSLHNSDMETSLYVTNVTKPSNYNPRMKVLVKFKTNTRP